MKYTNVGESLPTTAFTLMRTLLDVSLRLFGSTHSTFDATKDVLAVLRLVVSTVCAA